MTEKAKAWLKKYYPIPANKCKKKDALAHSIRKWEGLQPKVLAKYGLQIDWALSIVYDETEDRVMRISAGTCALCRFFYLRRCPLMPRGCDKTCNGLWIKFTCRPYDAAPMLRGLKAAQKRIEMKRKPCKTCPIRSCRYSCKSDTYGLQYRAFCLRRFIAELFGKRRRK